MGTPAIRRKSQVDRVQPHLIADKCADDDTVCGTVPHRNSCHVRWELALQSVRQYPKGLLERKVAATKNRAHPVSGLGASLRCSETRVPEYRDRVCCIQKHELTRIFFARAPVR